MLDDRLKIYEVEHLIHKLIAHEIVSIHIHQDFSFAVEWAATIAETMETILTLSRRVSVKNGQFLVVLRDN